MQLRQWIFCHEATSSETAGQRNLAMPFGLSNPVPTAIGRGPESSRHDVLDEGRRLGFSGSSDVVATRCKRKSASSGRDSLLGRADPRFAGTRPGRDQIRS